MSQENVAKTYANKIGYSDVEPFEVVKTISESCLEIRQMNAQLAIPATMIAPGGFVGHFDNGSQKWNITSESQNPAFKIKMRKDGNWRDSGGSRYIIADHPRKVYDYNY